MALLFTYFQGIAKWPILIHPYDCRFMQLAVLEVHSKGWSKIGAGARARCVIIAIRQSNDGSSIRSWLNWESCALSYMNFCMQLAVLEARSKGWGRIGQAPAGRSKSAPRGVPRSRIAAASRPPPITVSSAARRHTCSHTQPCHSSDACSSKSPKRAKKQPRRPASITLRSATTNRGSAQASCTLSWAT